MSNSILLLILLLFYTISGAGITILAKYIYLEKSKNVYFEHNWFIIILMYFAEMMGIPLYYITHHKNNKKEIKEDSDFDNFLNSSVDDESEEKVELPRYKKILFLGYPFIFDQIPSCIGFLCLIVLPGSIYNMLRGLSIIFISFSISKFYLRNKHTFDQSIAFIISIIGFIIVGLSAFFGGKQKNKNENDSNIGLVILNIGMIFISMFLQSIAYFIREFYMKKYLFPPFLFIGTEGLFGFIFNIILCIMFYFIECGTDPSEFLQHLCTKDEDKNWKVENIIFAFEQMFENKKILFLIIGLVICLTLFNMLLILIIKYGGAMSISLVENTRTFFVWLFFILPWVNDELRETFNWIRLIGLIFIFVSIIVYFGFLKFDERKEMRKKLEALSKIEDLYEETETESKDKSILSFEDLSRDEEK